jgi:hypothetical protein
MARVPKWHAKNFFVTRHSMLFQIFSFLLPDQLTYIVRNMCISTHMWWRTDCIRITVLPNNTASETFLHKAGAVRSVDWIFINGSQVWRYLGEYVTWDTTFYSTRNTPPTQVSKLEPHEQLLRRTTSVVVWVILVTLCLDCFVSGQLIPSDKHP